MNLFKNLTLVLVLNAVFSLTTSTGLAQAKTSKADDNKSLPGLNGPTYGQPVDMMWSVGAKIVGGSKPCSDLLVVLNIPSDWAEQVVTLDEQIVPNKSREVKFRDLESGVKQIVVTVPTLRADEELTFEAFFSVRVSKVIAPTDTTIYKIPKTVPRDVKQYLDSSPGISFRNGKMRSAVKDITENKTNAWEETKAIYDWITENVQQTHDEMKDALDCFQDKKGPSADIVGLFVGMCRIHKIPARTVWVDGTEYAEFYLVDGDEKGYWFPAVLTGVREFGSMSEPKVILQKGDNIRVPEKSEPQRFVTETMKVKGNTAPKSVNFFGGRVVGKRKQ